MRIFQKGFNYSQDGEGNRLVLHLQGCNMRCPWCSNPEGLNKNGVIMVNQAWLDDSLCPKGAINQKQLDRRLCDVCEKKECVSSLRSKGLRLSYEELSMKELADLMLSSKLMYYDGGGVTFTGGECTLQLEELKEALIIARQHDINTALETNGSHMELKTLFPYLDHIIIDCKLVDAKKHKAATGIDNTIILDNIKKAAARQTSVHIRVPLIGGVNNSDEDIEDFIRFFKTLRQDNTSYEILKYHEYGRKKWADCGLEYTMTETAEVSRSEVDSFIDRIIAAGLHYKKT